EQLFEVCLDGTLCAVTFDKISQFQITPAVTVPTFEQGHGGDKEPPTARNGAVEALRAEAVVAAVEPFDRIAWNGDAAVCGQVVKQLLPGPNVAPVFVAGKLRDP